MNNSNFQYQSLLGLSDISADDINVDSIQVNTLSANKFIYPNGAVNGYILETDVSGIARWIDPLSTLILTGDVNGALNSNVVSTVGGSTASLIHSAELLANASTNLNTFNQIVKRDSSGNFSATNITANLLGTANNVITNANLTGMVTSIGNSTTVVTNANLTGMVTSVGNSTTVVTNANLTGECTSIGNATTLTNSAVIGKVLTGFVNGAGTVTATDSILTALQKINGNQIAESTLSGDVTGSYNTNIVSKINGTAISGATTLTIGNYLVLRDSLGSFSARDTTLAGNIYLTGNIRTSSGATNYLLYADTTTGCTYAGLAGNSGAIGSNNVGIGKGALSGSTISTGCIAIGLNALSSVTSNLSINNVAVGGSSLLKVTSGQSNIGIGATSLLNTTTGNSNLGVGSGAGTTNITGSNNTCVGNNADVSTSALSNCLSLGFQAVATASNTCQIGNSSLTTINTSANISANSINCITSGQFGYSVQAGANAYQAPTSGGTWIGWNRILGTGRSQFMNQNSGASGGFEWLQYNSSNVLQTPTPLMSLDSSGNITNAGTISASSNISSSGNIFASGICTGHSLLSVTDAYTLPPNQQGSYIGWNASGGNAETNFINQVPSSGFTGSHCFYRQVAGGSIGSPLTILNGNGNLFHTGNHSFATKFIAVTASITANVSDIFAGAIYTNSGANSWNITTPTGSAMSTQYGASFGSSPVVGSTLTFIISSLSTGPLTLVANTGTTVYQSCQCIGTSNNAECKIIIYAFCTGTNLWSFI